MTTPQIYINGKAIALASGPCRWSIREGINPVVETFDVVPDHRAYIEEVAKSKEPFTLSFNINGIRREFKNLWILESPPADNPYTGRVKIADRRWFWKYAHFKSAFNVRRNVGTKSRARVDINSVGFKIQDVDPNFQYAKWSLKKSSITGEGFPWNPIEAIHEVLTEVMKKEGEYRGLSDLNDFTVSPEVIHPTTNPLEDVDIDQPGDKAIGQILTYAQQAGIYVNANGQVIVFNKAGGGELDEIKKMVTFTSDGEVFDHIMNMGHAKIVKNNLTRPGAINVLFSRLVEVRLDFIENPPSASQSEDARYMDNVLPLPDGEVKIHGDTVTQGSWVSINIFLFAAWGPPPTFTTIMNSLLIRRAMIPFNSFFAAIKDMGELIIGAESANWAARIAALEQNYRRTYAISRVWVDRTLRFLPYRVATVVPSTGRRAPASVYSDYCMISSQKVLFSTFAINADKARYGVNINGYPANGKLDSPDARLAPADITIIDQDQGILSIDYRLDLFRNYDMILPSQIDHMPAGNLNQDGAIPIAFNAIRHENFNDDAQLKGNHKVACVISAIPASPNTAQQFHRIRIGADDSRLKEFGIPNLGEANGPEWDIRVGGGLALAKVIWSDDQSKLIERCFGIPENKNDLTLSSELEKAGLVINAGVQSKEGKDAALDTIALGIAAKIYASLVDRVEGTVTGHFNNIIDLNGWMDEIVHEVNPQGVGTTKVTLPDKIPELDIGVYLPDSTKRIIKKMVEP